MPRDEWFCLNSGPCPPAFNMALDDVFLQAVGPLGRPVLRFYGWTEPAATFGYSQRFAEVSTWTLLRPLIRRPTGGGLVPHAADWTYSVVVPPGHWWYELKAIESYRTIHEWIRAAFTSQHVSTELAPTPQAGGAGQCFVGAEKFDLLQGGVKLAGAAQRRNRLGLLIQGSVQPGATNLSRAAWEEAMLGTGPRGPIVWDTLQAVDSFQSRAVQLAEDKYSQKWYNQGR